MLDEVSQTRFGNSSHVLRNTVLITLTNDILDDSVRIAIVVRRNDEVCTEPTMIVRSGEVDGESQGSSGDGEVHLDEADKQDREELAHLSVAILK